MVVTSVSGHLMKYDFAGRHRGWNSCEPIELFHAELEHTLQEVRPHCMIPASINENAALQRTLIYNIVLVSVRRERERGDRGMDRTDKAQGSKDLGAQLKSLARSCQMLVLWLDCDREGENISFEVIKQCRSANNRLEIKRARFSSLTKRSRTVSLPHPHSRRAHSLTHSSSRLHHSHSHSILALPLWSLADNWQGPRECLQKAYAAKQE